MYFLIQYLNYHIIFSESTCADEVATVASNTFIFGSKTSLNGLPVSSNGQRIIKPNTITANLENRRCNGEIQNDRKKNAVVQNKNVLHNRVRSPVPRSATSSSCGGLMLSQSKKPWFINTTRNQSSLDEMKELNLEIWNERKSASDQQLDKDVLY
jgi:hypothetical protein